MTQTDRDAAKAALRAAFQTLTAADADHYEALAYGTVVREAGDHVPGPDYREAALRLTAYFIQSRPKIGSRLVGEAAVSGAAARASGVRALLAQFRTPGVWSGDEC